MRGARCTRRLVGIGPLVLLLGTAAAAPPDVPEVFPLRVPSGRVAEWFPPGSELKGMSSSALADLLHAARAGASRRSDATAVRLLAVKHAARWLDGRLEGRSEFRIEVRGAGPGSLRLDPWSPAIESGAGVGEPPVRADDAGRVFLRVEPAPGGGVATAVVSWHLRARPGSGGRRFALALPGADPGALELDLPEGLEPEGPPGLRLGPLPASDAGRAVWSFVGRTGASDLRLVDPRRREESGETSRLTVEGTTRVAVGESSADWALVWSVTGAQGSGRTLVLDVDGGVTVLAASGPEVEYFRSDAGLGGSTRLTVSLRGGDGTRSTVVTVRGLAAVPSEGAWAVPSARPVNALWTGGRTTIRLDPTRVLAGARPLGGFRVASPPGGPADERRLDFEAERPGPVAELWLHQTAADVAAEVSGLLVVGGGSPQLTCRVTWRVDRGRPLRLDVDLPGAWSAERVALEGVAEAPAWHAEARPDGSTRLHISPPTGDLPGGRVVVKVWATASVAGGRGPLALPRVRPVGARVADEVWVARAEPGVSLQPTRARGLAWIDPAEAGTSPPLRGDEPEGLRPVLAWRWTDGDGEARVERGRAGVEPRGAVEMVATVAPTRLAVTARVVVQANDEPIRTVVLGLSEPVADPEAWRVRDVAAGVELRGIPAVPARRAGEAAGARGAWRSFELPRPRRGRLTLEVRYEGRWGGRGKLPLVLLPAEFRPRGTVLVEAARDVRTAASAVAARVLDPGVVAASRAGGVEGPFDDQADPTPAADRPTHAFAYDGPDSVLELSAEALTPGSIAGVIREADLIQEVAPDGAPARTRLVLKVVPEGARSLGVALPEGSLLEQVRRDGVPVVPAVAPDGSLEVPLGGGASGQARAHVGVTLDYRSPAPVGGDRTRVRPDRLRFSLPCLSTLWEVIVPEPWTVVDWGPALTPTDPALVRPGPADRFGFGRSAWGLPRRWLFGRERSAAGDVATASMFADLDARVAAHHAEGIGLGDWLTRLDAGRWPIVVDRGALGRAGWGPRSRVTPAQARNGRPAGAEAAFGSLGLALVPLGRAWLVTTPAERPATSRDDPAAGAAARARWEAAVAEAGALGSDGSGRFLAVSRWWATSPPRAGTAVENAGPSAGLPGRASWRFAAVGWPEAGMEVRLVDRREQAGWTWAVALAAVTLGLACRRRSRPVRAAATAGLAAAGFVATVLVPPWYAGAAYGMAAGACALAFFQLGAALPGLAVMARRDPRSTVTFRRVPRAGLGTPAALALAALAGATPWALAVGQDAARAGRPEPILVLFPYDGPPEPERAPARALLRLADYDRLRALAENASATPAATLAATDARHRVVWRDGGADATVETELTLAADGGGRARWTFPVGEARAITATVDGADAPVRIEAGGRSAAVEIDVDGRQAGSARPYRLRLRRTVALRRVDGAGVVTLPINPVASARAEVGPHPGSRPAEVPLARGRIDEGRGDDGTVAWLGPVDRLEVRWPPPGGPAPPAASGTVDGLYLWDALPAGDRVRARLTYRGAGGTPLVRIRLGEGAVVRELNAPGADVSIEGAADRPEWVARFDPPLPDGGTVALDVWRPFAPGPRRGGDDPDADDRRPAARSLPTIEPLGVERTTVSLAFRRPSDWLGRIAPAAGSEPLGEEVFARAWGSLPVEPLTLSGAIRIAALAARGTTPGVETGPRPARLRVKPAVQLAVAPGRIDATIDAELTEVGDPVDSVEVAAPPGFRIDRVSADGLTDWERPDTGPVRLRFDGAPARVRKVRIRGWLVVADDPLVQPPPSREVAVVWPRWPGHEELPGTLSVLAPTRFRLLGPAGKVLALPDPPGPGIAPGSPFRTVYRVEPPGATVSLRWEVEPPRVTVFVRSQVTLDPDSAEWVAVLRYEVSGGPLEEINLRLPSAWARGATVRLDGVAHQQVSETRGDDTVLAIRPDQPVWGVQRVVVRSTVPFRRGDSRPFPELRPRGWGKTDTYLRLVNATGQAISVEGSGGVRPVSPQAFQPDEDLTAAAPRSAPATSYHVVRGDWSLQVQRPGPPAAGAAAASGPQVARAEIECTVGADGTVLGVGRFDLTTPAGSFLPVGFGPGSVPLAASVGGNVARPLRAGPGRWLIPLAAETVGRVTLLWESKPPDGGRAARPNAIPLPDLGARAVPATVTVFAPAGVEVAGVSGRLAPASAERVALDQAGWLAERTAAMLPGLDRSSRRDAEDLVADLVHFERLLRHAARAADGEPGATPEQRTARAGQVRRAAGRLRDRLAESIRNEALDDLSASARFAVGLADDAPALPTEPTPDPQNPGQVRVVGHPHGFLGVLATTGSGPPALTWVRATDPADHSRSAALLLLAATLPALGWGLARLDRAVPALARLGLAAGLVGVGLWGGPYLLLAALACAVLGGSARA